MDARYPPVAVKVLDLEPLNVNLDTVGREMHLMRQMQHPNVVPIFCSFVEDDSLWIVMPLLDGGSCANLMKYSRDDKHAKGLKDSHVVATILRDVLEGLQYFHADGNIHRDVKAGNILMSSQGDVQLADFGVAATIEEPATGQTKRKTFVGTPCWMAPEVLEGNAGYSFSADIWSFGITALELAYGRAPYINLQPMMVLLKTLREPPPTAEIYKDGSYAFAKSFHKMVAECLQKDPAERPTAKALLKHKFFKKYARGDEGREHLREFLANDRTEVMRPVREEEEVRGARASSRAPSTGAGIDGVIGGDEDDSAPISFGSFVFLDPKKWKEQAALLVAKEEAEARAAAQPVQPAQPAQPSQPAQPAQPAQPQPVEPSPSPEPAQLVTETKQKGRFAVTSTTEDASSPGAGSPTAGQADADGADDAGSSRFTVVGQRPPEEQQE